eukprot:Gb_07313 [translate_table: standard]
MEGVRRRSSCRKERGQGGCQTKKREGGGEGGRWPVAITCQGQGAEGTGRREEGRSIERESKAEDGPQDKEQRGGWGGVECWRNRILKRIGNGRTPTSRRRAENVGIDAKSLHLWARCSL